MVEFIVKVPVPAATCPDVNDGLRDGDVPESFVPACPVTGVFSIVVVASDTATGILPTVIVIVELLHTSGLTAVLQIVYVVVVEPVNVEFGVKVYWPVTGLMVMVPVLGVNCVMLTV